MYYTRKIKLVYEVWQRFKDRYWFGEPYLKVAVYFKHWGLYRMSSQRTITGWSTGVVPWHVSVYFQDQLLNSRSVITVMQQMSLKIDVCTFLEEHLFTGVQYFSEVQMKKSKTCQLQSIKIARFMFQVRFLAYSSGFLPNSGWYLSVTDILWHCGKLQVISGTLCQVFHCGPTFLQHQDRRLDPGT